MRKCNAVTSFAVILIWTALLKIVCLLQWQHVVGSWRCCLSARTFGFEFTLAWSLWSVRVLPMSAWVLWLPPTVQWHGVRLDGDSKLALGVSVKTVFVPYELYRVDLPLRLCSVFRTADWDEMSTWYFFGELFLDLGNAAIRRIKGTVQPFVRCSCLETDVRIDWLRPVIEIRFSTNMHQEEEIISKHFTSIFSCWRTFGGSTVTPWSIHTRLLPSGQWELLFLISLCRSVDGKLP